jgi:hypothetical protein
MASARVIAGGAPLQWRVMVFQTVGVPPAHDHERLAVHKSMRRRATGVARPQQGYVYPNGMCSRANL